ncbi:MAG: hypothetical protein HYX27_18065 [Acidobacteria bacterium]|nr:hypothetical protein [Acidobacteriota bacterium]
MPARIENSFGFTRTELAVFRKLSTTEKVQRFLDEEVLYDPRVSCRSPRRVLNERRGHCMEGALLAATAIRLMGYPPLVWDLEAQRDDDHVLTIFRRDGLWGAIGKSNYSGLRYREPVYKNLRELAMSYFEHFFNPRGERTLRGYSRPINLSQFDATGWMVSDDDPWHIPNYLTTITHTPLIPRKVVARLTPLDSRLKAAGEFGMRKAG